MNNEKRKILGSEIINTSKIARKLGTRKSMMDPGEMKQRICFTLRPNIRGLCVKVSSRENVHLREIQIDGRFDYCTDEWIHL